ncbi:MAG: tyrosine-protein phosphatase [Bacteroidaceae bacterium]|nr:tyrosine-protein phosphatase [Bacteroidaceae bacterium]
MNKKHLLLSAVLCWLVSLTATASIPADGTKGYFYNPATGKFLSHGVTTVSNSGAKVDLYGVPVEIKNEGSSVGEFSDATYNYIRFQMGDYYGRFLRVVADGLDCAGSSYHKWAVTEVASGQFVIRCIYKPNQVAYATQGYYVAIDANDELVLVDGLANAAVWEFLTPAQQQSIVTAAANARAAAVATQAGITASSVSDLETAIASMASMDKTDAITNPTMYLNTDGWTVNNIQGTAISNGSYQIQNAAGGQSMTTQTVTGLTPGLYKVEVQAFYRASVLARCQTYGNDGYVFSNAYFKANDNQVLIKDWYAISTDNHSKPTSRGNIKDEFNEGTKYTNTVYTYVGSDGNLALTIAVPSYAAGDYPNWICFNNVRLTYYYNAEDLSAYEAQLATTVANAQAVTPLPTQAAADLASIVSANNQTYTTSADYQAAIDAIADATTTAQAVSAAYSAYQAQKTTAEAICAQNVYTDPDGAVSTFNAAVDAVDVAIQGAALSEAVTTIGTQQAQLRPALASLMSSVTINDGAQFDLTSLLTNAVFTNVSPMGWDVDPASVLNFGKYSITELRNNIIIQQTLQGLPAGAYCATVEAFQRIGNHASDMSSVSGRDYDTYLFLNDASVKIMNIVEGGMSAQPSSGGSSTTVNGNTIYIPNSRSHLDDYFAAHNYLNTLEATLNGGDVTIGFKIENYAANNWACLSDFHLYYRGPLDLSAWQEQLAQTVSAAQNLVIPTLPRRQLTDVIQQNNKTYTTAEDYQAAIAAINAAVAVAEPYVEPYADYKTMRQMIQERFIDQTAVYTDEGTAASDYSSALSTANTNVENVSSVAALEAEKQNLWAAALTFLKSVTINEGQGFDLTWMIQDADFSDTNYKAYWTETLASSTTVGVTNGVMRYYNSSFDLGQTLPYMLPAGAYKMTVDGFERTNDPMNDAWADYQSGNSIVTGAIYLNGNEQLVMNLFDYQGTTNNSLSGEQPSGASFFIPNGSSAANKYLQAGHYPNTLIGVLADDALVTIGYRCANTKAWTAVDNFKLWYIGEVPQVALNNAADELTPVCAPFTLDVSDDYIDELYALAGEESEGSLSIYPVNTVPAGTPCYAKFSIANYSAPMEMTLTNGKKFVMPWAGGWARVNAANDTWTYYGMDGNSHPDAEIGKVVLDFNDMEFDVNMENLAARRYLNLVSYSGSSEASEVAAYNVAPPTRRDIPNAVMIPLPAHNDEIEIIIQNSNFEEVVRIMVPAGATEAYVYNLLPQETYKFEYFEASTGYRGQFHTKGHLRMVYAPSAYNIRDLGGWETQDRHRTTYGHLFRGSTLNGYFSATAEDLQTLRDLGVGGEIDLRWKSDHDKDMGCGTSAFGFTGDDYYFAAANDYTAANLNESGTQQRLKQEFDFILNHFRQGKAVYFHCAWGADRTGMLSFLLEGLLGLTIDQIYKDYELTSFSVAGNRLKTSFQDRIDVILALEGATLRDKFENYFLNKLGVPMDDITYFRSVMLEVYPLTIDEDANVPAYYNGKADITLHRTLKADKHNTVVLPCDLDLWKAKDFFGKGTKIENIVSYEDGVLKTEAITKDTDIAPANKPFLLVPTEPRSDNTYVLDEVTMVEGELSDAVFTNGKMVGTYAAMDVAKSTVDGKENYVISNDKFYVINETAAPMKSTRAYLVLDTPASGVKSIVTFDSEATGIDQVQSIKDDAPSTIYDLSGRRVGQPTRGLYIVNGKKVYVK